MRGSVPGWARSNGLISSFGLGEVEGGKEAALSDEENSLVGQEVRRQCISSPMMVWYVGADAALSSSAEDETRPVVRLTFHLRLVPAAAEN